MKLDRPTWEPLTNAELWALPARAHVRDHEDCGQIGGISAKTGLRVIQWDDGCRSVIHEPNGADSKKSSGIWGPCPANYRKEKTK